MTTQHSTLTGSNLHESKGIDTASAKMVYVTNGSGSGTFKKIGTDNMFGLTTDGGATGKKLLTNGSEGFTLALDAAYASMSFVNNSVSMSVANNTDSTLETTTPYILLTGTGAPWTSSLASGITFSTDKLTVSVTGVYELVTQVLITSSSAANNSLAIRHKINNTTYGSRRIMQRITDGQERVSFVISELITLTAADFVQIAVTSNASSTVVFNNANVSLKLIKQTA
jgi:hypothetical protein